MLVKVPKPWRRKIFSWKYYWMFSLYKISATRDLTEATVFFLSVCQSGDWDRRQFSLFFPEGWLGTSILKQFYTQSNIRNKLDEREMKKAADYLLSVEIQMEEKRESHWVFQDQRYLNRKKSYYVFWTVFLPLRDCSPQMTLLLCFATYIYLVDGFYCFSWEIKLQQSSLFFPRYCKHH